MSILESPSLTLLTPKEENHAQQHTESKALCAAGESKLLDSK